MTHRENPVRLPNSTVRELSELGARLDELMDYYMDAIGVDNRTDFSNKIAAELWDNKVGIILALCSLRTSGTDS